MSRSLKRRLLWILLGLILVSWTGSAAVTAFYASRVLLAQVDRQLEQYVDLVSYITSVFNRQLDEGHRVGEAWFDSEFGEHFESPMVVDNSSATGVAPALNIWVEEQLLVVLRDSPRFDRPAAEGFSFREIDGGRSHWRLLTRRDEVLGLWVVVGIDIDQARRSLMGTLGRVLFPLVLIIPLTLVVLFLGIDRGLKPLQNLAGQISRRNPRALDPVKPERSPAELDPVVAALNDLLERLSAALESEQRFTANAAHELTTPLAAIKTEVQLCQRLLTDPQARPMLERIAARVDRAHHTVEQLLTLARLDPASPLPDAPVALDRLLREVVAETAHLAAERGLELRLERVDAAIVGGNEEALAILLRNLLVNALRYASDGSAVDVALESEGGAVTLSVSNDCDALAVDEFQRLTQRFYRVPGSRGLGAGLGLSIAARVAALHGTRLQVSPAAEGRGFVATVCVAELSAQGSVCGADEAGVGGGDDKHRHR